MFDAAAKFRMPHAQALEWHSLALLPDSYTLREQLTYKLKYVEEGEPDTEALYAPEIVNGQPCLWVPRGLVPRGEADMTYASESGIGMYMTSKPRNGDQVRVVEESTSWLQGGVDHILKGHTGFGKSYCGLHVAANIDQPFAIVCTKSDSYDNWLKNLLQHTNITEDEVGFIKGPKRKFKDKKVVIAMVQTLAKNYATLAELLWDRFGLVIFDEVHRLASDEFRLASQLFNSRHRLGLTATDKRKDGRSCVFMAHIGPVLVETTYLPLKPKVVVVNSDWKLPSYPQRMEDGSMKVKPMHVERGRIQPVLKYMAKNMARNQIMVDLMLASYRKPGRFLVFFSDSVDHLNTIQAMLIQQGVDPGVIGMYHSKSGKAQHDFVLKSMGCLITLTTYGMTAEATDVPWWNVGILGSPRANVQQTLGRLLREFEGKPQPVLFDILDTDAGSPVFMEYFSGRQSAYAAVSAEVIME